MTASTEQRQMPPAKKRPWRRRLIQTIVVIGLLAAGVAAWQHFIIWEWPSISLAVQTPTPSADDYHSPTTTQQQDSSIWRQKMQRLSLLELHYYLFYGEQQWNHGDDASANTFLRLAADHLANTDTGLTPEALQRLTQLLDADIERAQTSTGTLTHQKALRIIDQLLARQAQPSTASFASTPSTPSASSASSAPSTTHETVPSLSLWEQSWDFLQARLRAGFTVEASDDSKSTDALNRQTLIRQSLLLVRAAILLRDGDLYQSALENASALYSAFNHTHSEDRQRLSRLASLRPDTKRLKIDAALTYLRTLINAEAKPLLPIAD